MTDRPAVMKWHEEIVACIKCEDTVVLQERVNAGVYCTCDNNGIPMKEIADRPEMTRYLIGKELSGNPSNKLI